MKASGELSYGMAQEAGIVLARETYPRQLNVTFTRGSVSSQVFVNTYVTATDGLDTLIPAASLKCPRLKAAARQKAFQNCKEPPT
jgi:hypothetical protein